MRPGFILCWGFGYKNGGLQLQDPGSRASAPIHDAVPSIGVVGFGYLSRLLVPLLQRKIVSLMAEAVTVDILLRGDPYCVLRDSAVATAFSEVVAFAISSISDVLVSYDLGCDTHIFCDVSS